MYVKNKAHWSFGGLYANFKEVIGMLPEVMRYILKLVH